MSHPRRRRGRKDEPGDPPPAYESPFRPPSSGVPPAGAPPGGSAPSPKPDQANDPILYWFLVTTTPVGGAPEAIRLQWQGVALPVRVPRPIEGPSSHVGIEIESRQRRPIDDGVVILVDDALRSLRHFGRVPALAWWSEWFRTHPPLYHLVFRTHEGRLVPPSLAAALVPEIESFESW